MKIKRYSGSDMRSALRKVREDIGADAVILSNQRTTHGVEIVAATDYDESLLADRFPAADKKQDKDVEQVRQDALDDIRYGRNLPEQPVQVSPAPSKKGQQHNTSMEEMQSEIKSLRSLLMNQITTLTWENESRLHPVKTRLMQRLMGLGLSPRLAKSIASGANENIDMEQGWHAALAEIAHRLDETEDEILETGGVVALIGATGVGKTTTVAKLAARFILRHGPNSVALITTDNYRVAAHEQLRSYARIMGVPMRVAADEDALSDALMSFKNKGLVLIDTAGMSQRDVDLSRQLALIKNGSQRGIRTYLTLATNTQRGVLDEVITTFSEVPLAGCILTKVDETTSLGGALSCVIEHQLPVAYISDGQQVPEDLHRARSHSLVTRSVSIMQSTSHTINKESAMAVSGMVASYG